MGNPMKYRHLCVTAWLVAGLLQSFVIQGSAEPVHDKVAAVPRLVAADFRGEQASGFAHELADWVVRVGDHQDLPFVVVDKVQARVYVFDSQGYLLGAAPVLLGLAQGDDGTPGIGDRPLSNIHPEERNTPAGRFVAALAYNLSRQEILWVDYEQGISMHPVRSINLKERRQERLDSSTVKDNRISYGCINVSQLFWHDVLKPTFVHTQGIVYVMPETRSWQSVFGPLANSM